jgi:hypothetical protein
LSAPRTRSACGSACFFDEKRPKIDRVCRRGQLELGPAKSRVPRGRALPFDSCKPESESLIVVSQRCRWHALPIGRRFDGPWTAPSGGGRSTTSATARVPRSPSNPRPRSASWPRGWEGAVSWTWHTCVVFRCWRTRSDPACWRASSVLPLAHERRVAARDEVDGLQPRLWPAVAVGRRHLSTSVLIGGLP